MLKASSAGEKEVYHGRAAVEGQALMTAAIEKIIASMTWTAQSVQESAKEPA